MVERKKSIAETHPEVAARWHPTLNGDLTPNDVTFGSAKKIWLICNKGKWPDGTPADDHIYEQRINLATSGYGCPCCSGDKVVPSNCLATTHPESAARWHPTLNGDLTPNDVTFGSHKKAWFVCDKGKCPDGTPADDHIYEQMINLAASGYGCPCCCGDKVVPSNCLATTHPEVAARWHPTLNGDLTPNDVTAGNNKKVWFVCDKGKWPDGRPADDHVYEQKINHATNGYGCPCCYGKKAVPSNCLATTHPEIAARWHPTLNGDLTPNDVTYGSTKNALFICNKNKLVVNDHVYKQKIKSATKNKGHRYYSFPSNCLAATHPEIAARWHPTLNGNLTPNDATFRSHKKAWLICDKGKWPDGTPADDHVYEQVIESSAAKNYKCPCCSGHKAVPSNCLATTHPEVAAQWHPTLNGGLTPNDVTCRSSKEAWFVCDKGKWPDGTPAEDHVYKLIIKEKTANENSCPYCDERKAAPSNCLAVTHPEVAARWHPTLNGNLTPNDVTARSSKEVWFVCNKGRWPDGTPAEDHVYEQRISDATDGFDCPCCCNRKIVASNCLAATHPEVAARWHPTLNGDLTPNDVTYGSTLKAWFVCSKGRWPDGSPSDDHIYEQVVMNAAAKELGCPCCSGTKVVPSNCLATTHPDIAAQWHPTLNGNLTPNDVTAGSNKKAWWKCDKGKWPDGRPADDHVYEQVINSKKNGRGCPCCSGHKKVPSNKKVRVNRLSKFEW